MQDALVWAEEQFGSVELGDKRRTKRAVAMAAGMAAAPAASLPGQMGSWGGAKAAYRLLDSAAVSAAALSAPHRAATRAAAEASAGPVLFIQDTTVLDYSGHTACAGLGPTGDGRGRGLLLHSTLAAQPTACGAQLLGLAASLVWARPPVGRKRRESSAARQQRDRESQIWPASLRTAGPPPPGACWVSVSDAESDVLGHLREAQLTGYECLVRACQDRRVETPDGPALLLQAMRAAPARAERRLELASRGGQPARTVDLAVSWLPLVIQAPAGNPSERGAAPIACWGVRAWNAAAGLEWVLLSTRPVASATAAVERLDWYACRWLIEEYHKALKTGCAVEQRRLESALRLERLLGFLMPLAVRLLQARESARATPDAPARGTVPEPLLLALAHRRGLAPDGLTVRQFWRETAKLGGFLARKSDGEPGWQTLWRGALRLADIASGMTTAQNASSPLTSG